MTQTWGREARPWGAGPHVTVSRLGGGADGVADGGEGLVGVGAQGRDSRDAHDDDQGQHDRVLNGRRAVFTLQETDDLFSELTHVRIPFNQDLLESRPAVSRGA